MICPYCNNLCYDSKYDYVCKRCYGHPAFQEWDIDYYYVCATSIKEVIFEVDFEDNNGDGFYTAWFKPNQNLLVINMEGPHTHFVTISPPFYPEMLRQIVNRLNQLKVFI